MSVHRIAVSGLLTFFLLTSLPALAGSPFPVPKGCEKVSDVLGTHIWDEKNKVLCINGTIDSATIYAFEEDMVPRDVRYVVLNSGGGTKFAGEEIAKFIREKGIETYVPKGFKCLSNCAWVFSGGVKRYAHDTARIGFHYVYTIVDKKTAKILKEDTEDYLKGIDQLSNSSIRSEYYRWAEKEGLIKELDESKDNKVARNFTTRSFWIPKAERLYRLGYITHMVED